MSITESTTDPRPEKNTGDMRCTTKRPQILLRSSTSLPMNFFMGGKCGACERTHPSSCHTVCFSARFSRSIHNFYQFPPRTQPQLLIPPLPRLASCKLKKSETTTFRTWDLLIPEGLRAPKSLNLRFITSKKRRSGQENV